MKKLILLVIIFLAGCDGGYNFNPLQLLNKSTQEKKETIAYKLMQQKQELTAAHQLDNTAVMCFIVIGAGVALMVFGLKKIGISVLAGGGAALGALWSWSVAQQLVVKHPHITYAIGAGIIILLVVACGYMIFVKHKALKEIIVGKQTPRTEKLVKKIKEKNGISE